MLTFLWNANEKRLRAVWRLIIQIVLFFSFSGIIGVGVGLLVALLSRSTRLPESHQRSRGLFPYLGSAH